MNLQWVQRFYAPFSFRTDCKPAASRYEASPPMGLSDILGTLTPNEKTVLELRFGIFDGCSRTLQECGKTLHLSRERIRQIEAKALRKLRHPKRIELIVRSVEEGAIDCGDFSVPEPRRFGAPKVNSFHSFNRFDKSVSIESPKKPRRKRTRISEVREWFESKPEPVPTLELVPGWSEVGIHYIHYDPDGDNPYYRLVDGDSFDLENMPGRSVRIPTEISKKVEPRKVFWFAHEQALHEEYQKHFAKTSVRIGKNYVLLVVSS